ncbi:MAG: trypsin-like peptidase domain-containing protein [Armatimonadota bacterium]|nr:trypsin-like peptidase domain-containing protein [Armatimonadota bacterium]
MQDFSSRAEMERTEENEAEAPAPPPQPALPADGSALPPAAPTTAPTGAPTGAFGGGEASSPPALFTPMSAAPGPDTPSVATPAETAVKPLSSPSSEPAVFYPAASPLPAPATTAPPAAPASAVVPAVVQEPLAPDVPRPSAISPVLALLMGGVLACLLVGLGLFIGRRSPNMPTDSVSYGSGDLSTVSAKSGNAIVDAVRRVGPAVMNVDTTFGKEVDPEFLPDPSLGPMPRQGKGTGVVINKRLGLMLTNAHVVAGAKRIQATSRDGTRYAGRIIGSDRQSDIAVVKLSSQPPAEAKLASFKDARQLAIGQWAIAIGNPFAQANTVTVGVISAVGRSIPVPPGRSGQAAFQLTDMIQTDAAINPGNSGGPLCNINGEVIGINTAIIPFATGLGFSIPINKAKIVADQLVANRKVQHPYIGIEMKPVSEDIQKEFGMKDQDGALVTRVQKNAPAAQGKLQEGDVIRSIDGQAIRTTEDVQRLVGSKKVGDVLKLKVLRNNTVERDLTIKIGDRPDAE